jgi:hypothetical protein
MVSNVSLYPFDPTRDEYAAYELAAEQRPGAHRGGTRQLHGQIRFEVPWVSIPDTLNRYMNISLEELEVEMERAARSQEH